MEESRPISSSSRTGRRRSIDLGSIRSGSLLPTPTGSPTSTIGNRSDFDSTFSPTSRAGTPGGGSEPLWDNLLSSLSQRRVSADSSSGINKFLNELHDVVLQQRKVLGSLRHDVHNLKMESVSRGELELFKRVNMTASKEAGKEGKADPEFVNWTHETMRRKADISTVKNMVSESERRMDSSLMRVEEEFRDLVRKSKKIEEASGKLERAIENFQKLAEQKIAERLAEWEKAEKQRKKESDASLLLRSSKEQSAKIRKLERKLVSIEKKRLGDLRRLEWRMKEDVRRLFNQHCLVCAHKAAADRGEQSAKEFWQKVLRNPLPGAFRRLMHSHAMVCDPAAAGTSLEKYLPSMLNANNSPEDIAALAHTFGAHHHAYAAADGIYDSGSNRRGSMGGGGGRRGSMSRRGSLTNPAVPPALLQQVMADAAAEPVPVPQRRGSVASVSSQGASGPLPSRERRRSMVDSTMVDDLQAAFGNAGQPPRSCDKAARDKESAGGGGSSARDTASGEDSDYVLVQREVGSQEATRRSASRHSAYRQRRGSWYGPGSVVGAGDDDSDSSLLSDDITAPQGRRRHTRSRRRGRRSSVGSVHSAVEAEGSLELLRSSDGAVAAETAVLVRSEVAAEVASALEEALEGMRSWVQARIDAIPAALPSSPSSLPPTGAFEAAGPQQAQVSKAYIKELVQAEVQAALKSAGMTDMKTQAAGSLGSQKEELLRHEQQLFSLQQAMKRAQNDLGDIAGFELKTLRESNEGLKASVESLLNRAAIAERKVDVIQRSMAAEEEKKRRQDELVHNDPTLSTADRALFIRVQQWAEKRFAMKRAEEGMAELEANVQHLQTAIEASQKTLKKQIRNISSSFQDMHAENEGLLAELRRMQWLSREQLLTTHKRLISETMTTRYVLDRAGRDGRVHLVNPADGTASLAQTLSSSAGHLSAMRSSSGEMGPAAILGGWNARTGKSKTMASRMDKAFKGAAEPSDSRELREEVAKFLSDADQPRSARDASPTSDHVSSWSPPRTMDVMQSPVTIGDKMITPRAYKPPSARKEHSANTLPSPSRSNGKKKLPPPLRLFPKRNSSRKVITNRTRATPQG